MNPIWFLYPFIPLTSLCINHSLISYEAELPDPWFRASVLRQSAQALWVLPHLQAIFKGSLKFLHQRQPTTTNPNPDPSQPTNQQNQSCEPTSWVDAVVLASDNATSPWCGIVCRCRKTFAKMIKGLLLFSLLLQVFHQVIHVGSLENMYKVFQQTLFWGFLFQIKITLRKLTKSKQPSSSSWGVFPHDPASTPSFQL